MLNFQNMKNITIRITILIYFLFLSLPVFAQQGKDGALTVTTLGTVVNRYSHVTANIPSAATTIPVSNIADLNRDGIAYLPTSFVTNDAVYANNALSAGDAIIVYQAQGAIINTTNTIAYGDVINYNNTGQYEIAKVASVAGNVITVTCGLKFAYTAAHYIQVIRIPQYTTLTINTGASIVPVPWGNAAFGGADESANERRRGGWLGAFTTTITNNGVISANSSGFRGGTPTFNGGASNLGLNFD